MLSVATLGGKRRRQAPARFYLRASEVFAQMSTTLSVAVRTVAIVSYVVASTSPAFANGPVSQDSAPSTAGFPAKTLVVDAELDSVFLESDGEYCRMLRISLGNGSADQDLNIEVSSDGFSPISRRIGLSADCTEVLQIPIPCGDFVTSAALEVSGETDGETLYAGTMEIGPFREVDVYVGYSSHEDFGWAAYSLTTDEWVRTINLEALDLLAKYPQCKWTIETVFAVKNLLDLHADKKADILRYLNEGRLEIIGSWINPFRVMFDGESYIRQFTVAGHWLKNNLGYTPRGVQYYDVAWHWCGQMPQILRKAGLKWYIPSPGGNDQDIQYWQAPDGTKTVALSLRGYGGLLGPLRKGYDALYTRMNALMKDGSRSRYYFPAESDWSHPSEDIVELVTEWNRRVASPRIIFSLPGEFLEKAKEEGCISPPAFIGPRRPKDNDLETMACLNDGFSEMQRAEHALLNAEEWAGLNELITGASYPQATLEKAWQDLLYAEDHNLKGGSKTAEILEYEIGRLTKGARRAAQDITALSLRDISTQAKTSSLPTEGTPIVVFNRCAFERTEPVDVDLEELGIPVPARDLIVRDSEGRRVAFQGIHGTRKGRFSATIGSIGFATFYLSADGDPDYWTVCRETTSGTEIVEMPATESDHPLRERIAALRALNDSIENEHYRITFDRQTGMLTALIDKELSADLLRCGTYFGGELYCELIPCKRTIGELESGSRHLSRDTSPRSVWIEKGPVYQSVTVERPFVGDSWSSQTVTLHTGIKRVDISTSLAWKGWEKKCLKMKVALPLNLDVPEMQYAAPCAIYHEPKPESVGRYIQGWCNLYDPQKDHSIAVSTTCPYLQYDESGVSIYLFMDRVSSIGWLLQNNIINEGVHSYKTRLVSHRGDWTGENTFLEGRGITDDLLVVKGGSSGCGLPAKTSFLSVSPENVIVSAIKKPENGSGLILRCYETVGKDSTFTIDFFLPIIRMLETDLMEETLREISAAEISSGISIGPFEIKTFRIET